jgi:hypothetical protein
MTLPQNSKPSLIPLFGQNTDHSSVLARICTAVARSGGQGRPLGQARQRFTLDGREHDSSFAISRDDRVHRGDLRILDTGEQRSAC